MRVIETRAREVAALRFSPDGGVLTALSRQPVDVGAKLPAPGFAAAFRIDLTTGEELRQTLFGPSRLAAISFRGTYLAHVPFQRVKGQQVVLAVMNLVSGEVVHAPADAPLPLPFPLGKQPFDLTYLSDGQTLAVALDGVTRINMGNGSRNNSIEYPAEWLYPSPSGRYFAAGHNYLRVRVWDRWKDLGDLPFSAVRMAASTDGWFAAVRQDGIRVGRFEGMQVDHELPHAESVCSALSFSPDGRVLATADPDGRVGFWDPATGELKRAFEWGIGPLHSLTFAPDGLTCAAGGDEGRVVVWDVDV
jgi:WD40 repeat protein